ncbi:unnamed protein product [Gongylonema pulchrum]|uniref:C2H2-type domain-containing protein n=1 Tax=Gongylonema pulchrum TaxID=637853 RepID=A0A183EC45_9BILA|nr:unnamed protein product [Gongylonema pulchrum]
MAPTVLLRYGMPKKRRHFSPVPEEIPPELPPIHAMSTTEFLLHITSTTANGEILPESASNPHTFEGQSSSAMVDEGTRRSPPAQKRMATEGSSEASALSEAGQPCAWTLAGPAGDEDVIVLSDSDDEEEAGRATENNVERREFEPGDDGRIRCTKCSFSSKKSFDMIKHVVEVHRRSDASDKEK